MQETQRLEERILKLLEMGTRDPSELAVELGSDFDKLAIKQAIWHLLDLGRIELTADRKLSRSHVAA